ncbi:MAG: alanine-synthesizing transaminase [Arenicella sp.]|jgi:alanine-synthesizing transaminase
MIYKSQKLAKVSYDIRGPIYQKSQEILRSGESILQLNIGNPAPYGFHAPKHLIDAVSSQIEKAQGYVSSNGIDEARTAIRDNAEKQGISGVSEQDVYIGNGVSELISIALQVLLNPEDEILLPAPDYPLWTSTVHLFGGKAVHYLCDESSNWFPDLADLERKITPKTKALVLINPNNPTGAVYPKELLEKMVAIAKSNNLLIFSDEIYDRIVFDGVKHIPTASIDSDVPCITFGGLSKNYMATGFRAGWLVVSGKKHFDKSFFDGLDILMSMRLCSNALAQLAIKPALEGVQEIDELVLPKGRLKEQRDFAYEKLISIEGISCVKPQGALYMFPKFDSEILDIENDSDFVFDLLTEQKVLVVQGSGFNWKKPDHFRITFLPSIDMLDEAIGKIGQFTGKYLKDRQAVTA